ncbi:hypothetical protein NB569_04665 [Vibrio alginolyticus]|uniref:hypothetical protein n=1 Tax=Vibrio alginolyticus TaxID=663 RepID=UPI00215C00A9|nr:hypothetical protein [Vibrio alginolyticus]MCR9921817.1 hypothetical protein [Vibrio alginolyticus]
MHELGAGSRTISRLTKVPRSTVRMYTKVQRAAALIHSPEFQQEKDRIKKGLRNNPAWSRLGVAETKAEARQRLRAERQQRLADEAIPHTPVPTVQQVAKAKAEAQIERAATFQMHDKHGNYGSVRQDRAELLRKRVAGKVKR